MMADNLFYIFWGISVLVLWATLVRVVYLEQQYVDTGMKYGHVVMVAVTALILGVNILLTFYIWWLYPNLFGTKGGWINRSVHKAPSDQ